MNRGFLMTCLGYAPQGQRCCGKHNGRARGRTNSALLNQKLLTVTLLNGSVDADVFKAWATQEFLPHLPKNSIIVMDNAAFHKRQGIQDFFTSAGHTLDY